MKVLLQELGQAINESLCDSEQIAATITEIKRAGYDVFLVLEATIGFNKRTEEDEEQAPRQKSRRTTRRTTKSETGRVRWSVQDQKFLRALKIAFDD